jgi:hypothetical protein
VSKNGVNLILALFPCLNPKSSTDISTWIQGKITKRKLPPIQDILGTDRLGHVYSKFQHSVPKYLLQRKLEVHQADLVTEYIYEKFIIRNIISFVIAKRFGSRLSQIITFTLLQKQQNILQTSCDDGRGKPQLLLALICNRVEEKTVKHLGD